MNRGVGRGFGSFSRWRYALARMLKFAALLWVCLLSEGVTASELVLRYDQFGPIYTYRWKLLELALSHTVATDGPFRLEVYQGAPITQDRSILMLQQGSVDILAFGENADRDEKLLPIRIDILRGILGYRILMIRSDEQAMFNTLDERTIREKVTLGFNSQWADLAILQSNGFKVVTSSGYENLFSMLVAGRFDAFPRGLNEIDLELKAHQAQYPDLAAEKSLAFFVDFPVYYWVRKSDTALANRIERGLKLALADGSFKALFQKFHAEEIARVKREKRKVIRLHNPLLPANFVPTDTSWWWGQ